MEKKFDKSVTKEIIDNLKKELRFTRNYIRLSYIKNTEQNIKASKERITQLGFSINQTENLSPAIEFLIEEREKEEKRLAELRTIFKKGSKDVHHAKEMVRHLEHAITILTKEFNQ